MDQPALTRVLIADLPGAGRSALAHLVAHTPGVALVANVAEPDMIEAALLEQRPEVVVVDDRLLEHELWASREAGVRLIVVGVDDDPGYAARAERLGAETWVAKDRADAILPLLLIRVEPVG